MKQSFTLIEILVVATIIGLLAVGGMVSYSQITKQSRDARRKADLEQIRAALEMYRSNNNYYISASNRGNCSTVLSYLTSGTIYLQKIPTDPKSTNFYYCNISNNDFTIGAYLETSNVTCVSRQCGSNCTYCLGPYGQK